MLQNDRFKDDMRTQTAMLTSQLHPIPRKNIWCHSGVPAFLLEQKRQAAIDNGLVIFSRQSDP